MHVTTPTNLVFDGTDPRCFIRLETGQHGKPYAFVQCVDASTNETRRYWGIWSHDDQKKAMMDILEWGGKWPTLPAPQG